MTTELCRHAVTAAAVLHIDWSEDEKNVREKKREGERDELKHKRKTRHCLTK